jgi:hypothetical protein
MPNPLGNPEFKSKYGEKTTVIRLPKSIADAIGSLLNQGCASSDILESLQPLTQEKPLNLAETDSTHVHLPVEIRLLKAIKDAAHQEKSHYLQWILYQCKKGLNLSPNAADLDEAQLTELIDKRFSDLTSSLIESLQAQINTYESRLTALEEKAPVAPELPIKPSRSQKEPSANKPSTKQRFKLPPSFPTYGISSANLAALLGTTSKTINQHRRAGNGLLRGWKPKEIAGYRGWRYFPSNSEALQLWQDALD